MNENIKELLSRINQEWRSLDEDIIESCSKAEADRYFEKTRFKTCGKADEETFLKWSRELFPETKITFEDFIEFSRCADGLNFNGLFMYSLDPNDENSIYETNEIWRSDNDYLAQYVFFADDNISWFCADIKKGEYWIMDKPGGTLMESFDTLNGLIASALATSLL